MNLIPISGSLPAEIIQTLRFDSETGMPQYDSVARRVYVNLRSANRVAEIDPSSDKILGQYPVGGCEFNHGMAVDSDRHRAFLLCGKNRTMSVFALDSHRTVAHLPLPVGADGILRTPHCEAYVGEHCKQQDRPIHQEQLREAQR